MEVEWLTKKAEPRRVKGTGSWGWRKMRGNFVYRHVCGVLGEQ